MEARCEPRRPCERTSNASRLPAALIVIMAHITDEYNCGLLGAAILSVRCFHPKDEVLVVDNDSPHNNRPMDSLSRPKRRLLPSPRWVFGRGKTKWDWGIAPRGRGSY